MDDDFGREEFFRAMKEGRVDFPKADKESVQKHSDADFIHVLGMGGQLTEVAKEEIIRRWVAAYFQRRIAEREQAAKQPVQNPYY